MNKKVLGKKIAFYVILLIVWQAIATADIWPNTIFPSPTDVIENLVFTAVDGSLFFGIGTSLWRLIVGLSIAIAGGMILGIFMARIKTVNQTIGSMVVGLQSNAQTACDRLALLCYGFTDAGIIFV